MSEFWDDSSDASGSALLSDPDASLPSTPAEAEKWSRKRTYSALPDGAVVIDANDEAPVEKFVVELERMMLTGHSKLECRRFAQGLGLTRATFDRYVAIIKATWTLESTTHFALTQRRDELRAMYREVYYRAMNPGDVTTKTGEVVEGSPDLMVALKTVDSMAKLDGLAMPDVAVQINQNATDGAPNATTTQLTNRTRERTMELLRLAKERAERHAEKTTKQLREEKFRVPQMGVVR